MLYLQPERQKCHFCETAESQVVFLSGQGLCAKCYTTLSPHLSVMEHKSADHVPSLRRLVQLGSLDRIKQAVVVFMKNNGSSVTDISNKLSINRGTVYNLLERAKKCKSTC